MVTSGQIERKAYTVAEVATILGISRSYAYEMAKQKKFPILELGKRMIVPKKKFDTWLEGEASQ
ncbi:MAG: helix-turn-helix domain-containing protein [Lachnospiraceae bacterium]|nr:helix-turn-helix domain-containing protein [Lachnospiraceae bacterium]